MGRLRWDGQGVADSTTALQWAAGLASRVYLDRQRRHYLGGQLAYGVGAGGGVAALGGQGAGAVLTPDGSLEAMPVWVTALALHYQWNDPLSSAFAFAWTELDPAAGRAPDAMRAGGAAHANLIWQVAAPFRVGGEVMYGRRENTDGEAGNATRIQFTAMYTF